MANKIYMQIVNTNAAFAFQLQDDPVIEAQSQYSSFGELIPGINQVVNTIGTAQSSLKGNIGEGILNIQNALNIPRWQSTDPLKVSCTLNFYTMEDAEQDVWIPTNLICNMSILSYNSETKTFITPGVSLASISSFTRNQEQGLPPPSPFDKLPDYSSFPGNAKLCSIFIPGILYLDTAFVLSAQPTFSKQKTEKGYPLWAKVECQFSSLYPANDKMLQGVKGKFFSSTVDQKFKDYEF